MIVVKLTYNVYCTSSLIRLEFNSVDCGYYTELDSVELCGIVQEGHFLIPATLLTCDKILFFRYTETR